MSDGVRWIRSHVLDEDDGCVGTVCVGQASSPEATGDHASRADQQPDGQIGTGTLVGQSPTR